MNLFGLAQKAEQVKFLVQNHSPAILTGMGVTGVVTTAYLTGRATFKAAELIKQEEQLIEENAGVELKAQLSRTSKVKLVWKLYVPPVGVGVTTIASIIMANKVSSRRIAALAAASSISERALQEYKDKVVEKLGERQDTKLRDEIAQDRVTSSPGSKEIILAGTGDVLCYDMHTGRYFQSSVEEIKRAENKINHDLLNHMHASASEFYDLIGLPPSNYTEQSGWNANNRVEVTFSSVLSPEGRPCLAMDFVHPPTMEYVQHWD